METPLQHYFLDASALVKLVCDETGSRKLKKLMRDAHAKPLTSWVLIAEVLGVLKRKRWREKKLDDTAYLDAVQELLIKITLDYIHPVDLQIVNGEARLKTYEVQIGDVRDRHPELDAADALQFIAIKEGMLSVHTGPTLVSADKKLMAAAEKEGIKTVSVCRD
jgi:predicted nucleic acid-binding protein